MVFLNLIFRLESKINHKTNLPSYTKVFAETLIKHIERYQNHRNYRCYAVSGTGLNLFEKRFPDRMFDVGIAEQHAVTFAAGLTTEGYKPFAASPNLLFFKSLRSNCSRCIITIFTSKVYIDRAGLVGADETNHAGSFDITYLSTLPNFVVMAASDEAELVRMVNTAVKIDNKPSALEYPRGNGVGVQLPKIDETLKIGKEE